MSPQWSKKYCISTCGDSSLTLYYRRIKQCISHLTNILEGSREVREYFVRDVIDSERFYDVLECAVFQLGEVQSYQSKLITPVR